MTYRFISWDELSDLVDNDPLELRGVAYKLQHDLVTARRLLFDLLQSPSTSTNSKEFLAAQKFLFPLPEK